MTTKEMIEVMQASLEGKPIQAKDIMGREWEDISNPSWDWGFCNYRVKPEPKYRPFNSAEEVMEAINVHGSWVISKNTRNRLHINGYCDRAVLITEWRNSDIAFIDYTFLDGTPFGKLEE